MVYATQVGTMDKIKHLEIEEILSRRVRCGFTEYMIKWKGHSRYVNVYRYNA